MNDFTVQNIIDQWVDSHTAEIIARLSLHMSDAATIEQVAYDSTRHRGLLMLYVYEGVQKIVDVRPESLLANILMREQEVMNRVNSACADAEETIRQMTSLRNTVSEEERLRRVAEEARAAAELIRESERLQAATAENGRNTAEQARQQAETARNNAEASRSSWFSTFRSTVENWFSSPSDSSGIKERLEALKSRYDSLLSVASSAWDTFFGTDENTGVRGQWKQFWTNAQQFLTSALAAESGRNTAEQARQQAEGEREQLAGQLVQLQSDLTELGDSVEQQSDDLSDLQEIWEHNELLRESADNTREQHDQANQAAETQRATNWTALKAQIEALFARMLDRDNHPDIIGPDGYWYRWDTTTQQYNKTNNLSRGEGFKVSKEFASVAAMKAYAGTDIPENGFVLIKTANVEDPDNSKLYTTTEDTDDPDYPWHLLGDFSGSQGFTGKTPQFAIGTVTAGAAGTSPAVSLSPDGQDLDGNPKYLLNLTIPRGDPGVGIASIVQTRRSAVSEGENVWKMTLTNGEESSFVVLNGQRGLQGQPFLYSDLTGEQKMELAGLARDYRLDQENSGVVVIAGTVTPSRMVVKVPESVSLKSTKSFLRALLYPSSVPQNVIFQKVSGTSAVVNPSGEIFALETGESVFWVIPLQNTSLWRQVSINVRHPRMRLTGSGRLRLGTTGIRTV